MTKTCKITIRLSKKERQTLLDFSTQQQEPISVTIRQLILKALSQDTSYGHSGKQSYGKQHLMRAERTALFSAIMADLMLREQTPPHKLESLKTKAETLLHSRWDYQDE